MVSPNRGRLFGIACYFMALVGQGALVVLVVGLGMGWLSPRLIVPWPGPIIVNSSWLIVFAAQHSGMARSGFKRWLLRRIPAHLERSLYVALSGLLTLGLALTWQPLPGAPLWSGPTWIVAVASTGIVGVVWISFCFDHREFFGLRQSWTGEPQPPANLHIAGPYRWVRHPLMTATLVFLWGHPTMPRELLMLSGGLTLYVLLALPLEERDLAKTFGAAYQEYRRKVPALIPWRGRFSVDLPS